VLLTIACPALLVAQVEGQANASEPPDTVRHEDATRTRLFFGPTARAAGHGNGHAGIQTLVFGVVSVGIGDRVTFGAGTPILPDVIGDVLYFTPKVTLVQSQRAHLAVGVLSAFLSEEIDEGSVGIVYGVGTFGSVDNAVTVGAGWAFALADDHSEISDDPLFMVGLERRMSPGLKLISENYIVPGDVLLSGGLRVLGERFAADMGLGATVSGNDRSSCLPILSVVLRF
jgi:hypothetical protein